MPWSNSISVGLWEEYSVFVQCLHAEESQEDNITGSRLDELERKGSTTQSELYYLANVVDYGFHPRPHPIPITTHPASFFFFFEQNVYKKNKTWHICFMEYAFWKEWKYLPAKLSAAEITVKWLSAHDREKKKLFKWPRSWQEDGTMLSQMLCCISSISTVVFSHRCHDLRSF